MRADRLIRIVLLLQVHGRLTAADLAERLEVSTRTIQRDLESLSVAGIPVYADRGRGGGWSLARDYRTRLDGLSPTEAASLFVGSTAHVQADLGFDAASDVAMTKLLAALPANARRDAELARERVLVDHTDWWDTRETSPWMPTLQQALWDERWMRLEYGTSPEAVDVAPLGLVSKKRSWYLVAHRQDGQYRTYRVNRIRSALLREPSFTRPDGFDLAAYWEESAEKYFGGLRTYPVRLRVRKPVAHRLRWAPNAVVEESVALADGWCEVAMTFESAYETRVYLLGLAGDIVVVTPSELRADMLDAARSLLADNSP